LQVAHLAPIYESRNESVNSEWSVGSGAAAFTLTAVKEFG
jgi:hypothetical protein